MRLYVYVLEAKDLSVKDSYVKLQVGKHKSKTRILRNTMMPVWNEEFVFRVHDMDEELVVSLFHHDDEPRVFHGSRDLVAVGFKFLSGPLLLRKIIPCCLHGFRLKGLRLGNLLMKILVSISLSTISFIMF